MSKERYLRKRNDAWEYYKKWMSEKTYCKVLGKEVKITRKGWDHIIGGKYSKKRSVKERINKLSLLKYAKFVIKSSQNLSFHKREDEMYMVLSENYKIGRRVFLIKVLIKRDLKHDFCFYSVMKH